jgi:hypothetical protein
MQTAERVADAVNSLAVLLKADRGATRSPVFSVLVRQLTDGICVFSQVDTDGDAPRRSDASGCTTAQRQPVIDAIELALSMPDRLLGRDRSASKLERAVNVPPSPRKQVDVDG